MCIKQREKALIRVAPLASIPSTTKPVHAHSGTGKGPKQVEE